MSSRCIRFGEGFIFGVFGVFGAILLNQEMGILTNYDYLGASLVMSQMKSRGSVRFKVVIGSTGSAVCQDFGGTKPDQRYQNDHAFLLRSERAQEFQKNTTYLLKCLETGQRDFQITGCNLQVCGFVQEARGMSTRFNHLSRMKVYAHAVNMHQDPALLPR